MTRIEKVYKLKYILSNGKVIVRPNKRSKAVNEWQEVSLLSAEEVGKYLKLGKGKDKEKYKDTRVIEMHLLDWVGNKMVSRVFEEEVEEENNDKEKECNVIDIDQENNRTI